MSESRADGMPLQSMEEMEHGAGPGWLDRWARQRVVNVLQRLQHGRLSLEDDSGVYHFGSGGEPAAQIRVHHPCAWRQFLLGGSVGGAEAYMAGDWSSPCLVSVVRVMARNLNVLNGMESRWPRLQGWLNRLGHRLNANTLSGSRRNIAAHYDLGNDFFELFLDSRLMYSAAVYDSDNVSLEQAAFDKLELVCQKLQLSADDHLLEIGTGWGGLAIHAASRFGCRVTTTTLSRQQYRFASEAVKRAGLEDRVTLLLQDYRQLEGQYDKLVSVEMIEAVGHEYYDTYFARCSSLLKVDGLMLIQAITITDQRYDSARRSVDFIQKYIFPGGGLPSVQVIASGLQRCTDMVLVDLHDIGQDYARTLSDWRQRFLHRMPEVKAQGFDEFFCRMWDYYLAYCEGGSVSEPSVPSRWWLPNRVRAIFPRVEQLGRQLACALSFQLGWLAALVVILLNALGTAGSDPARGMAGK
ncbi:SAM-dependent methyltransferase [Kineobactrum salinum]|uniref:SAM-dependent methyltransferase n=1 Tax=Kineobactrum salinum TaxID=2708301 RepID=UPI001E395D1F|nr:cyclopropane-fatty-acyl-phospholipid synthase family protein [Kineobactrum salinum]